MVKWTDKDLKKLGIIVPPHSKAVKIPKNTPTGVLHIKNVLTNMRLDFVEELRFAPPRRFRFDFAIQGHMIAIEYEGLNSEKSGHTTLSGYTSNCEKYNMAAIAGWRLLRYTVMNYEQVREDLTKLVTEINLKPSKT